MDLNKYWADVKTVQLSLPPQPIYYLTSIDSPDKGIVGGRVMDVPNAKQAAERIVGRTHRLSTPEEIAQFKADLERQEQELADIELKRKGHLAMPQDLTDLVRMAVKSVESQTPPAAPGKKER
jgi:cell division ATPase FtsA